MSPSMFCTMPRCIFAGILLLAAFSTNVSLSGQDSTAVPLAVTVGKHQTRSDAATASNFADENAMATEAESLMSPPPPTRSSFMATWPGVTGAKGYLLDVSTTSSFDSFVDGYHDLDVGEVTGRVVTGLNRGTTYYYRVRAYDDTATVGYSETAAISTEATTGLTIHPTFDSSITGKPNAAAIQATINRAIAIYESMFSDPITIQIRFRYATTAPDGSPLPQGLVSESDTVLYTGISWNTFISALRADARTSNDNTANASLPGSALSPRIRPGSANGRAVGLNTPPAMFANGSVGAGGPYDGIVTLNSSKPFQFSRPVSANNFDAQRLAEHEIDEVIGLGSRLGHNNSDLRPQDLFSWSSAGHRNITSSGTRYFSINSGVTNIVGFNQRSDGDFGDWFSAPCPQAHPYPQNAFSCPGQSSDISPTSPEGINLDVIGYDLSSAASSTANDFNNDGHPDYVLYTGATRRTVIWYLNNNVHFASGNGPTLPSGWNLVTVADFNQDGHPDYLLYNPASRATVIWYLVRSTFLAANHGPQLVSGWEIVGTGDFNDDGHSDLVLYRASTNETVIWYLNNSVRVGSARGPTLPGGWSIVAVADFNSDGNPDYLLFKSTTGQSVIWYLSGVRRSTSRSGPTIPGGYQLIGVADFDGNGTPDYVLYNPGTQQTGIWYLADNLLIGTTFGPTLPGGWSLVAP